MSSVVACWRASNAASDEREARFPRFVIRLLDEVTWQGFPYFVAGTRYLQLADKAQRTVVLLTERLDHHRGRGQQQITVKHVTVNADQAIVGNVTAGGGLPSESKDQPHAIAYAPGIAMPSQDQARELVSVASHEKRAVPDARRKIAGRPKGK
jgi:hypothetical protein